MARYAMFFTYTPATWQRLVTAPEDRTDAIDATFRGVGGSLVGLHYLLGPHDGIVIVDVPDTISAAAVAALVSASGAYAHVETHLLLTPAELVDALDKSGPAAASFVPPGSRGVSA
jgi:uncharacterized protein with GYD domain